MNAAGNAGILPRDYLVTSGGLYFAVVMPSSRPGTFICSLRYARGSGGGVQKLDTAAAYRLLRTRHPRFLGYCADLDSEAVSVRRRDIDAIYRPVDARKRLESSVSPDSLETTALRAIDYLHGRGVARDFLGVTGSLMLGFHRAGSDIDIVIYDYAAFNLARNAVAGSVASGELAAPDAAMWRDIHGRRACALGLEEYVKHEERKHNKFILDDTKVDISYVPVRKPAYGHAAPVRKLGPATLKAVVTDASRSFDYPARYAIDNDAVGIIYCYTATYTGQALAGETIEAAGMIEEDAGGNRYLVIGTSREAPGEYLKVTGLR